MKPLTIEQARRLYAESRAYHKANFVGFERIISLIEREHGIDAAHQSADALDAARYRWLRSRLPGGAYRIAGVIYSEGGAGVDAAIDAAMARESSESGGAR